MLEHERAYLPLVQNPLIEPDDERYTDNNNRPKPTHSDSSDTEHGDSNTTSYHPHPPSGPRPVGTFRSTTNNGSSEDLSFRRFNKATDIELFYDLFFVANLTVFTYVHEVNDADSLKQYIGFFSIIWFTWYQVSLYDVRFYMDSVFERSRKAIQFLVMIGFAICGPEFNVGEETNEAEGKGPSLDYFQGLTIILMISRLVLVAEYGQIVFFARHNKKKIMIPVLGLTITYLVAAMVYLGLYWTFTLDSNGENHTYIVWYVVAVLETAIATAVSMKWRNLSFVGTHLVERMSLLTLIIFGEGAIAIAKACQYIVESRGALRLENSVPAEILCAVLNLYFLYMIYFDWIHEELFGTIRQQIWAFLHFPLHVALVLAAEGASQCITWNAAVRRSNELVNQVEEWQRVLFLDNSHPTTEDWMNAATDLNETANYLLERQLDVSDSSLSSLQGVGYYLQTHIAAVPAIQNGTTDSDAAGNAVWWLTGNLYNTIFKIGGFYTPETETERDLALKYVQDTLDFTSTTTDYEAQAIDNINKAYTVFRLTYIYFFVAVGSFVVLTSILATLNRGSKSRAFFIRLTIQALIGLGLALLATMAATESAAYFILSPWLLPTITICLFGIVVMNAIPLAWPGKKRERRREGEKGVEPRRAPTL